MSANPSQDRAPSEPGEQSLLRLADDGCPHHGDDPLPTQEELFACLEPFLKTVGKRLLRKGYPKRTVSLAVEQAYFWAAEAICTGVAQEMTVPYRRGRLWVIARHAAVTITRREYIRCGEATYSRAAPLPKGDVVPAATPTPLAVLLDRESASLMCAAFDNLPKDTQNMIRTVVIDGVKKQDVAKSLNLHKVAFRRRFQRALRLLRAVYERLAGEN